MELIQFEIRYSQLHCHMTIESSHYVLEGTEAKFWLVVVGLVEKTLLLNFLDDFL